MPLPANDTPWPPATWKPVLSEMQTWDAWWVGDTARLREIYQKKQSMRDSGARFFHGRHNNNPGNRPSRQNLHIPIASDICATNADLIYGTPPDIVSDAGLSAETSARITEYVEDGLTNQLLEGSEAGAALTGRYHQVVVDPAHGDMPFLTRVDADHAIPMFRWGRLVAVTFWSVLPSDGTTVWRHVEHHELDPSGNGVTLHGLYEGTADNLGTRKSLADNDITAGLTVNDDGVLASVITPGLNVEYFPNITPQRRWRTHPQGRNLGRSDLDGLEGLMDALDEVYTSWMRDIRLAKARVFVDRTMLEPAIIPARGHHTPVNTFDQDREYFVPINGMPGREGSGKFMHAEQFNIRVKEHAETAQNLVNRIIRAARYSTTTFDDSMMPANMTATEVRARQDSTAKTRDRKIRLETPPLLRIVRKMLTIDTAVYGTPGLAPENVTITWPPLTQTTMQEAAQTVQALSTAGALSLETKVQMAHPDWDSDQVDAEVAAIRNEQPLASPDAWRPNFNET